MASKTIQLTRQVKPLLSVDSSEARGRVLSLYKAWYRFLPIMIRQYNLPVSEENAKNVLRKRFEANKNVQDIRVIDMLVIKGQSDLREGVESWSESVHILSKYFEDNKVERPKDFMSKFLAGQD